jgi:nucleoside-diphosphate-sugar epimerase
LKILVTGGTGFTGSHLVKRLLERGHQVLVLDKEAGLFFPELTRLGAQIQIGDILDKDLVTRLATGCQVVFHLAAAFRQINLLKKIYWQINVEGTRNLAETCLSAGVERFIYCSTEGVHGCVPNPPADETAPIAPKDYYQYTKYEGEKAVAEVAACGLKTVVLRPTAIYGPGDPGRFLMLFKMAKKGFFPMFGSGKITYHPVYIDNFCDVFELAMTRPEAVGQTYIVADEKYYSLNEIVSSVARALGKKVRIIHLPFLPLLWASYLCEWLCFPLGITPVIFVRRADWYRENRGFSSDKAKNELGYRPRIGLDEGLRLTAKWYQENGYL